MTGRLRQCFVGRVGASKHRIIPKGGTLLGNKESSSTQGRASPTSEAVPGADVWRSTDYGPRRASNSAYTAFNPPWR